MSTSPRHPPVQPTSKQTAAVACLGLAIASAISGCQQPASNATPSLAASSARPVSAAANVTIDGVLTRKGPDSDSWWAVTTSAGVVWRLADLSAQQLADATKLNQRTVRVQGTKVGEFLDTAIIRPQSLTAAP